MDELLICFGGELKSAGDGHFTGRLVRFSDASDKDLAGDYFTKETDFGIKDGQTTPVYFNHRLPIGTRAGKQLVVKTKIGEGTLKVDEEGVLIDAILFNREKYEKAIIKAGKAKKLGWSSGTAKHLVDRDEDGHIKSWPLGLDASVTPTPCEPHNDALPVKSYEAIEFAPVEELEELTASAKSVDGERLFTESLRQTEQQTWELWSAVQTGARKIVEASLAKDVTGVEVDVRQAVTALVGAYGPKLIEAIVSQVTDYLNSEVRDEHFYLKSTLVDEFIASGDALVSDASLEGHSQAVVSAVAEFAQKGGALAGPLKTWLKRLEKKQEFRANDPLKAGRVISQANRDRIAEVMGMLKELMPVLEQMHGSLSDLHTMAEPKKSADPDLLRGLIASFEMTRQRRTLRR